MTILFFGASVGTEAALSGIVGGMITFIGDKMKERFKKMNVVNQHPDEIIVCSMQVSVGLMFRAPLFGLYTLSEKSSENIHIIKHIKVIVYTVTTIASFLVFINHFTYSCSLTCKTCNYYRQTKNWIYRK